MEQVCTVSVSYVRGQYFRRSGPSRLTISQHLRPENPSILVSVLHKFLRATASEGTQIVKGSVGLSLLPFN